jgi:hypothetical protein
MIYRQIYAPRRVLAFVIQFNLEKIKERLDEFQYQFEKIQIQSDLDTTRVYTTRTSVIRGFFSESWYPQLFRMFEPL